MCAIVCGALVLGTVEPGMGAWTFADVSAGAGVDYTHGYTGSLVKPDGSFDEVRHFAGGVAVGDYDGDGQIDLYAVRGDVGPNLLFRNLGDGTFEERGALAGVDLTGVASSGPAFVDLDGDGWLDLFVGGVAGSPITLLRNLGDGTFADVTAGSGFDAITRSTFSAAFADYDRDGDLDAALAHWASAVAAGASSETLWRNDGSMEFSDVSLASGIAAHVFAANYIGLDMSFSPNFADIDADGWPDVLLASDFDGSLVLRNLGDDTFADITDTSVITDENGMGAAIGDYDNDGILDWFVTSIWDPDGVSEGNWGVTGNRLYRGNGDGTFADATTMAGVREGFWGWGATFADLDDDGHLDIFHVNGFGASAAYPPTLAFFADPARLFVSDGDGTFTEQSAALGAIDTQMGRGVSSFDYDRDGDLDLFVANTTGDSRLFENDGNAGHSLTVRLQGVAPNSEAIGARVHATSGGATQMRELRAGCNYESQDPAEAHFGLGAATLVDRLRVFWPSGGFTTLTGVTADQTLDVAEPAGLCGNGIVESTPAYGEDCDAGPDNGAPGSCCQVNCRVPAGGSACLSCSTPLDKPLASIGKIHTPPGDDSLTAKGAIAAGTAAAWVVDPVATGLRVFVAPVADPSTPVADLWLPAGAFDEATKTGWKVNKKGTRFQFTRKLGETRETAVVSRTNTGGLLVRVAVKKGSLPIVAGDLPLALTVILDPTSPLDLCAQVGFAASGDPSCSMSARGRSVVCR